MREQPARAPDPTVIEELDAWENRWFPVAEATLRRRKPEIADKVFLNLAQTSGIEVAVSVSTQHERSSHRRRGGRALNHFAICPLAAIVTCDSLPLGAKRPPAPHPVRRRWSVRTTTSGAERE